MTVIRELEDASCGGDRDRRRFEGGPALVDDCEDPSGVDDGLLNDILVQVLGRMTTRG
jgi:hypothetical protein